MALFLPRLASPIVFNAMPTISGSPEIARIMASPRALAQRAGAALSLTRRSTGQAVSPERRTGNADIRYN